MSLSKILIVFSSTEDFAFSVPAFAGDTSMMSIPEGNSSTAESALQTIRSDYAKQPGLDSIQSSPTIPLKSDPLYTKYFKFDEKLFSFNKSLEIQPKNSLD
jgi:hypothetical protein